MNSLAERLRRLEDLTREQEDYLDVPKRKASKPINVRVTKNFQVEPVEQFETEKPRRENFDLEDRLAKKVQDEQKNHRRKELDKLTEHFLESASRYSLCKQVLFAIDYIELNGRKIATLMNTVLTSDFKQTLAVTLMSQLTDLDERIIKDMINVLCELRFPKIPSFIPDPEPEESPASDIPKKKSGFFKKK